MWPGHMTRMIAILTNSPVYHVKNNKPHNNYSTKLKTNSLWNIQWSKKSEVTLPNKSKTWTNHAWCKTLVHHRASKNLCTWARLLEVLYFKISKYFWGLNIVFVFVISIMKQMTLSSRQEISWGLITRSSCPLALRSNANNIASFRVSSFWLRATSGPNSWIYQSPTFTYHVEVYLGAGGFTLKEPLITLTTRGCLPTGTSLILLWKQDITERLITCQRVE